MKIKLILTALSCIVVLWACDQSGAVVDPALKSKLTDSLLQVKGATIKDSATAACIARLDTNLVKAKADSIFKAQKAAEAEAEKAAKAAAKTPAPKGK